MPTKTCFKCHTEKPLTEFYRHPETRDRLLGKCKACTRADTRANKPSPEIKMMADQFYRLARNDETTP